MGIPPHVTTLGAGTMPEAMHRFLPEAAAQAQSAAIYAYMLTVAAGSLAAGIVTGWVWAWRAKAPD